MENQILHWRSKGNVRFFVSITGIQVLLLICVPFTYSGVRFFDYCIGILFALTAFSNAKMFRNVMPNRQRFFVFIVPLIAISGLIFSYGIYGQFETKSLLGLIYASFVLLYTAAAALGFCLAKGGDVLLVPRGCTPRILLLVYFFGFICTVFLVTSGLQWWAFHPQVTESIFATIHCCPVRFIG